MTRAWIKYENDARGVRRYVRIDLKKHGNSELLEEFLDGLEAESLKEEPTIPWEEAKLRLNKIHDIK